MAKELNAFGVDHVASERRHGNFGRGGFEAIDEDRMFGVARDEVVAESAGVSGGVGRFAEALMGEVSLAEAEVDAGVTGLTTGLMTVGTVVIEVGAGAIRYGCGGIVPARGLGDRVPRGKPLQVTHASEVGELILGMFGVGQIPI